MKIVFGGDLFLGGDKLDHSLNSCIKIDEFKEADLRVLNLEQPITDINEVTNKSALFTSSEVIPELVNSKIDIVCLANNHIHDKGSRGIIDTIDHLKSGGIRFFGAGQNLAQAKKPVWMTDKLAIFGYCQYSSPTLNDIQLADEENPGVNPLSLESIHQDLDCLQKGCRAFLYIHWGREHVWLTQTKNLDMAKQLLLDDRVEGIIGSHPHRPQGFIMYNDKRAYFCLGNFLFPNFFISPPNVVLNKSGLHAKRTTRRYHPVKELTYKKWKSVNRISILVYYDTLSSKFTHELVAQHAIKPVVKTLKGFTLFKYNLLIYYINNCYRLPSFVYNRIEVIASAIRMKWWYLNVFFFEIRENGWSWGLNRIKTKLFG